ncbi:MAG: bifunctional acetate--CoA ligase family protein/GNAT family N-acetyltransferase [Hyphomicrobium sp.]
MTIRNLDALLEPASLALIGASPQLGSVGNILTRNLLAAGFVGPIHLVNPRHATIEGLACYADVAALPSPPDLAIIATPPATIPGVISALADKGTRAAVIITAGITPDVRRQILDAARPSCLRIQGANCLGLMVPGMKLDASFSHRAPLNGDLAFLSQSGAIITSMVDWSAARGIGFSHVVSLGDMIDVDFGDLLDYLASDTASRAILIYMEALTGAPKFISAARRAARVKPVVVVKAGRHEAGARAAMSHTGALAGADAAYDAAFRRTGLLRVKTLPELFAAAEMLARMPRLTGERLMILTNGGGAGVLAADELQDAAGTMATLSDGARNRLNAILPAAWSHANPVDIIGDAGPQRFAGALDVLMDEADADAILAMQCPTALASPLDNAAAVVDVHHRRRETAGYAKPLLTCWLGDGAAHASRDLFTRSEIATFETPSDAVSGFMQLVRHARAQTELMRTPALTPMEAGDVSAKIGRLIDTAQASGRFMLTSIEAKDIFAAAGIPVSPSRVAATPADVFSIAEDLIAAHGACVVKILSGDISHKSDVGGVRLAIESATAARLAAEEMLARVAHQMPTARLEGFMVEPMIRRPRAHEVIFGMSEDATFGPLMLFGAGGTAVEVMADRALALPPLDDVLARQLIAETRIARLLAGYRDRPRVDMQALVDVLLKVSDLVARHAEIRELDINPLLVDENGVIAIDGRIRLSPPQSPTRRPLAIKPYPLSWVKTVTLPDLGVVTLRPIRPHDEPLYADFFKNVTKDDMRMRFFAPRIDLSHRAIARFTQIDYAREMAFVAVVSDGKASDGPTETLLGVVRIALDPDLKRGEYSILLRSALKGKGLGRTMMNHLIAYAESEGVEEIHGFVLAENTTMINMATRLGFQASSLPDDAATVKVTLTLPRPT